MPFFRTIVLGCSGGPKETNLSGYLVSPFEEDRFITLDAGSLLAGLELAYSKGHLDDLPLGGKELTQVGTLFRDHIKAYLISHAHLDHIMALVINSQVDVPKSLFALNPTIDIIRDHIFNGKVWPNLGSEGEGAHNFYTYNRLKEGQKVAIGGTSMSVEAFPLAHSKLCPSTAFLLEHGNVNLLYFGDTASDFITGKDLMAQVWKRVGPLVAEGRLKGIFLECSYTNEGRKNKSYGHLNPELLKKEMHQLAQISKTSLRGLRVVITHRKEGLAIGADEKGAIAEQLTVGNDLGVHYIFASQGDEILI